MLSAYQRMDRKRGFVCDIDQAFMLTIFSQPCIYCGCSEQIGCDRIDNSLGHTRDNIVPACADCNIMRGDRFTHGEMIRIGQTVALVKAERGNDPSKARNEDHP